MAVFNINANRDPVYGGIFSRTPNVVNGEISADTAAGRRLLAEIAKARALNELDVSGRERLQDKELASRERIVANTEAARRVLQNDALTMEEKLTQLREIGMTGRQDSQQKHISGESLLDRSFRSTEAERARLEQAHQMALDRAQELSRIRRAAAEQRMGQTLGYNLGRQARLDEGYTPEHNRAMRSNELMASAYLPVPGGGAQYNLSDGRFLVGPASTEQVIPGQPLLNSKGEPTGISSAATTVRSLRPPGVIPSRIDMSKYGLGAPGVTNAVPQVGSTVTGDQPINDAPVTEQPTAPSIGSTIERILRAILNKPRQ